MVFMGKSGVYGGGKMTGVLQVVKREEAIKGKENL